MLSFKKSSDPDFSNDTIVTKLNLLLKEQVEQRKDLSVINALLNKIIVELNLSKQADDYYESHLDEHQTSPQTEQKTLVQDPVDEF